MEKEGERERKEDEEDEDKEEEGEPWEGHSLGFKHLSTNSGYRTEGARLASCVSRQLALRNLVIYVY